jgi:hypothetical protein
MSESVAQVDPLRRIITEEIYKAFGMSKLGMIKTLFAPIFYPPAQRFAQIGAAFDRFVENFGFPEAARRILPFFIVDETEAFGVENIPKEGPLLITSNHPGTYDSLVIAANMPRNDLKIIVGNIPFLENLPYAKMHLIFAKIDIHLRMAVIRSAIRHMQSGGALLIFPSGTIDPDPSFMPGATEQLGKWSRSIEIMARKVPKMKMLITIVSGVLSETCMRNPLTRLRQTRVDRQRVAEFIQVMQQIVIRRRFGLRPKASFAEPITSEDLYAHADSSSALENIILRARELLSQHMTHCLEERSSP